MPRPLDSGRINLAEHFRRLQSDLSSTLNLASFIEHATAAGSTAEQRWIHFLNVHLPARFRAAPAFIYDPLGHRSRQIDIAIYDHLHSPALYPNTTALHLPSDAVFAVFEVKPTFSRQWLTDAHTKAQSVKSLLRITPSPIHSGLLAKSSVWNEATFAANLRRALKTIPLDLGCSLDHGAFSKHTISPANTSLHFFLFSLLTLLSDAPPTPNLSHYFRPPSFN